jgi:hypothetical protein
MSLCLEAAGARVVAACTVQEALGLLDTQSITASILEWTLRLRRFSTLNDLLLAHSPYPTTDADAVFLALTPTDFAS